ncbi:MAG TPA: DUF2807 domain-containing protein [Caulobacteraceae bacterium]
MRRAAIIAFASLAGTGLAGAAYADTAVEIRDAAARVTVIPEARSDVKVQVIVTNRALPLTVRSEFDHTIVDGHLRHRVGGCTTMFGKTMVHVRGIGEVPYDALPQIVVRTPMDVHASAGKAVFGAVGRADTVILSNAGCGDWTIANVKGKLAVNAAGSGDVRGGSAGELSAHVAGSSDVLLRQISGPATVDVAGSGDVSVASISGPLNISVAGSGDVRIDGGHASEMAAHIAGSGDVRFGGVADSLNASIAGSGDVDVGKVTGPVHKAVFGSGDVNVGH